LVLLLLISPVMLKAQMTLQLSPSNYNGFNISCFGKNDGSIDLTISGGVPPYQISWSTGDSTEDLSNIPAGYYRVTVQDSDSVPNIAEAEITLIEPRSVKILEDVHTYPNQYNISVFGACNGMLSVSAIDGVAPYSWIWTDSTTATSRTSLCADKYTVEVTDANSCKTKAIILLTQPDRSDWQMTGNAGTAPDVNYIGTTDSVDLAFRTNNAERFRIQAGGLVSVANDLNFQGKLLHQNSTLLGVLEAGQNHPKIYSYGNEPDPAPFGINCLNPNVNTHQFDGMLQLHGTSGNPPELNILEMGFDGGNSIIEASGSATSQLANRLLINYYCGKDVVIGNGNNGNLLLNRDLLASGKASIGSQDAPLYQFDVWHNTAQGNANGIFIRNINSGNRNSEIKFGGPGQAEYWSVGSGLTHNNDQNFFIYDNVAGETRFFIDATGRVGIGVIPPANALPQFQLYVEGGVMARKVKVTPDNPFPDYVFESNYQLKSIAELERHIIKHKRLPGLPSAQEVTENGGFEIGEMQLRLLEKIEEQALYIIELHNRVEQLQQAMNRQPSKSKGRRSQQ
jgi:hypothetical protein